MNQRRTGLVTAALALTLALGYLWGLKSDKSADAAHTIRTYNVPADKAQELKNSINGLFSVKDGDKSEGWAQLANTNVLIVKAPREMQKGIADFVESYSNQKDSRAFIQLEYWMIAAESGAANTESLPELASVLDSIIKTKGPKKFRVVEEINSTMLNNEESQVDGRVTNLKTRSSFSSNHIYSSLEIRSDFGRIRTNVVATPNEFLVIGQNSAGDRPKNFADTQSASEIYHVIRAKVVETL